MMNPHPPAIPVRATIKSTYKPISRLHGDDLPKLKRLKKAEFSNCTTSFCLFSRRTLANKLNVWHRQHTHTLDSLRKEQLQVYHVMCRVQREKRRVQREEHEQLRENIRRLFHRQRKRHLLRRVIAKFKENVRRKHAEREELETNEENSKEEHKQDVVQNSVEKFKRCLSVSKTKTVPVKGEHEGNQTQAHITFSDENKMKDNILEQMNEPVNKVVVKKRQNQLKKRMECSESKVLSVNNAKSELHAPISPADTLTTTKVQKAIPPIPPTTTHARNEMSPMPQQDSNNPLITQTDAIFNVARVNTPKTSTSFTAHTNKSESELSVNFSLDDPDRFSARQSQKDQSTEHQGQHHDKKTVNTQKICLNLDHRPATITCVDIKEESTEANETDDNLNKNSSSARCHDDESTQRRREPNLVEKLRKEKEMRLQRRTEILDSEKIVRYSRKPYHDVEAMYGQPKRFEFLPPSRKLHHEQEKLVRAEHQVELEQQVKIDRFFHELFRPKDEEKYKFSKKDDEAEKPKKATLSLAGVLSGVFSVQLSDAPRGRQSLQDKFRRLQSCQYLRVYQPRRNSDLDAEKLTSWDAAEKSLRTGFGAFAMKR